MAAPAATTALASVDDYLKDAGSLDKALLPLGFLLVFCAQHQLLSPQFRQDREQQLSSVRFQEGPVTALLASHGGTLYATDFSPRGVAFIQEYLAQLPADFADIFGVDCYAIEDNWENYQLLANLLVRHLLGKPQRHRSGGMWSSIKGMVSRLWR